MCSRTRGRMGPTLPPAGHGTQDMRAVWAACPSSRLPCAQRWHPQAGSEAAGSDPPVTLSVTIGLGTFEAACQSLEEGLALPGHWEPE